MNSDNFVISSTYIDKTPFLDSYNKFVCKPKSNYLDQVRLFLSLSQIANLGLLLKEKGNCSTDDAVMRVAYGDVYDSHALTFFLYNFSALRIIERFRIRGKMLEIGCNNGYVSRLLQRNDFAFEEYWGMDFDVKFIVDGLSSFKQSDCLFPSNFFIGDMNKDFLLKSDYFDFVFMQEAFDHCKDKFYYAHKCLNNVRKVLKSNGYFYISLVFEHKYRDLYHWDHNYIWNKFEFENVIQDYFKIVNFTPLMTFKEVLENSDNWRVTNAIDNWPAKLSKLMFAQFVPERDCAVGAYLLQKIGD